MDYDLYYDIPKKYRDLIGKKIGKLFIRETNVSIALIDF